MPRIPSFLLALFLTASVAVAPARADDADAFQAIRDLRASGEVEKAAARAQALVAERPRDLSANIAYQDLQRDLGKDAVVEGEYKARAHADGATADDLFLYARLLRGTKAVVQLRAALKADPNHFRSLCVLGIELTALHDWNGADQALQAARALRPTSGVPINALGRLYEARRDGVTSERLYREAIVADPELVIARVNLGILLTSLGRSKDALDVLEAAAKAAPRDPSPLLAIGVTHLREDREDDAVKAFERALTVDPRSVATLNMLAMSYVNLGKLDLADKAAQRSLALNANAATTWLAVAHVRLAQENSDAAREAAEKALSLDADCAGAYHVVGVAFESQCDAKKAEAAFRRAVKEDPDSTVYHRALAQFLGNQDRWKEALREFQRVAELCESAPDALYDVALAQIGANDPRKAIETLEHVVRADPGRLTAWLKLGVLQRERVRDDKAALKTFREYVARGGKDARVPKWIAELEDKK